MLQKVCLTKDQLREIEKIKKNERLDHSEMVSLVQKEDKTNSSSPNKKEKQHNFNKLDR